MAEKKMTREEIVTLEFPLETDGQKITQVTIRRPKVRDIQAIEATGGDDFAKSVRLIANLTMLSPDQAPQTSLCLRTANIN